MRPSQSLIDTAYDWHKGGYPVYQFASYDGQILSEQHREDLIGAIEGDIAWCEGYARTNPETYRRDYADEPTRLAALLAYLRSAPIRDESDPFARYTLMRVWEADGFHLELYDTLIPPKQPRWIGETRLAYRLYDGGRLIFEGDDFGCGMDMAIDSDLSVASLLSFLSLQPGDTDPDYFASYTPEQLAWCQDRAEDLSIVAFDLENPEEAAEAR
jgi:hypothetical protein